MIITERFPQKSLYFLGAMLLKHLANKNIKFTLMDLYESFNQEYKTDFKRFMMTLDWLFLIGSINNTKDGYIIKCS
jgi:hypothetical protein